MFQGRDYEHSLNITNFVTVHNERYGIKMHTVTGIHSRSVWNCTFKIITTIQQSTRLHSLLSVISEVISL